MLLCATVAFAGAQGLVISRLRAGTDPNAVALRANVDYIDRSYQSPFFLFRTRDGEDPHTAQQRLLLDAQVVWAEDDAQVGAPENEGLKVDKNKGSTLPAVGGRDTLYAKNTKMLKQVNFQPALAGSPGRAVRIAILDTGLSPKPTYLWERVVAKINYVEIGKGPFDLPRGHDTNGNGIEDEGAGHGSMVTALVDQMAPQAQLVIVRVADSDGYATAWTIIKGLTFAAKKGCEVANVSLGSLARVPALSEVMDWCENQGLLVVAPIGNDNLRAVRYPADISKVLCVAGISPDNTKAPFSNWDGETDFSAPATGLASAWWDGDWATWSGTSFAAPLVAGIVADSLRRTAARMRPFDIRQKIIGSGRGINYFNPDYDGELGTLVDHARLDRRLNPPQ